jgi:hypothetical protein
MPSQVLVANDLTLVVGDEAVKLTPTEGFQLAQRLIRRSTSALIDEEIQDRMKKVSRSGQ